MRVFSDLILNTRDPVYLQLVRYVHLQICRGVLRDGDALPSRRELAVLLGINPNTAQKAYKALEEEGDRKSTRLNSSHKTESRMPSSA